MTIASMTGFAREAGTTGPFQWAWELKSVNGRGLDIRLRTPPGFDAAGEEARQQVQKTLTRGQCQLNLSLSRVSSAARVRVNQEVLATLVEALGRVDWPDGVRPASVDGLLAVRGVIEVEEDGADEALTAELGRDLREASARAAAALAKARRAEGEALAAVIAGQIGRMDDLVRAAEECPARQPDAVRARLGAQIEQIFGAAGGALDPDRLHQEAMLLAAKADIREELDRLKAHIASARELLAAGGAVGRRLDFLAQEFGREANTLCAKANDVSLSRIGLDLKAVAEQFREQVQNVE
ncbi:MAG: Protein YicC [uncultured Microvirga sp.]|uniref:Protein YicC n=1 Tax=uncultured Microvirga sp. TaxID=412392 RepID=A0A6J4L2T6_9HYPH|nr:MAG: Protein YicC [uncultured Microvirga sp.]